MKAVSLDLKNNDIEPEELRGQLLAWYDKNRRVLPWRSLPGEQTDPYHVWLSEIMLQQTTVAAVIPYYTKFLNIWPTIQDLAKANLEDVMKEWAGLGYYSRARNLHRCANVIVNEYGGKFPRSRKALKSLPGIGEYTSAAIKAIAFNEEATVVDGNVERVMSRLHMVEEALPGAKTILKNYAQIYFQNYHDRPGDLAQAFMDLGATICSSKAPRCFSCPVSDLCMANLKTSDPSRFPIKERKKTKPQKMGFVFWIENNRGEILVERRPEKGMLASMNGFPVSEWSDKKPGFKIDKLSGIDLKDGIEIQGKVRHSFTHFDLELTPFRIKANTFNIPNDNFFWVKKRAFDSLGFPTLFKKCLKVMIE